MAGVFDIGNTTNLARMAEPVTHATVEAEPVDKLAKDVKGWRRRPNSNGDFDRTV